MAGVGEGLPGQAGSWRRADAFSWTRRSSWRKQDAVELRRVGEAEKGGAEDRVCLESASCQGSLRGTLGQNPETLSAQLSQEFPVSLHWPTQGRATPCAGLGDRQNALASPTFDRPPVRAVSRPHLSRQGHGPLHSHQSPTRLWVPGSSGTQKRVHPF